MSFSAFNQALDLLDPTFLQIIRPVLVPRWEALRLVRGHLDPRGRAIRRTQIFWCQLDRRLPEVKPALKACRHHAALLLAAAASFPLALLKALGAQLAAELPRGLLRIKEETLRYVYCRYLLSI